MACKVLHTGERCFRKKIKIDSRLFVINVMVKVHNNNACSSVLLSPVRSLQLNKTHLHTVNLKIVFYSAKKFLAQLSQTLLKIIKINVK